MLYVPSCETVQCKLSLDSHLKLFGSYLLCLTYLDSFLKCNIFPMGNKLKAIHLICLLCIFCNLTNAQVFAKECDVTNSDDDQAMTCRVRTLHNIAEIGKSEIDHSTFLTLLCDDLNHEILVTNGTFAKLNNLQSIRIENCNIPVFPDYSFLGLVQSRKSVDSFKQNWHETVVLQRRFICWIAKITQFGIRPQYFDSFATQPILQLGKLKDVESHQLRAR
ncbi:hypothetical protein CEXT_382761 [Caerostris extrusa]|uniref:Uncharacterized protein n=1 Tax=Caerostris extrusa TaxID=172846 RepID=A0AAV4UG74_CAEEX|nr:hypothetical protein CEXT_382761 [Caerostris extrusa]